MSTANSANGIPNAAAIFHIMSSVGDTTPRSILLMEVRSQGTSPARYSWDQPRSRRNCLMTTAKAWPGLNWFCFRRGMRARVKCAINDAYLTTAHMHQRNHIEYRDHAVPELVQFDLRHICITVTACPPPQLRGYFFIIRNFAGISSSLPNTECNGILDGLSVFNSMA